MTNPEQSVREQLDPRLEQIFLNRIKVIGIDEHTYLGYPNALIGEVQALLDQISAERESLVRSECIQDIKDYGLTIENGKWITDSVIEGMYKARSERTALRQPTGEDK